MPHPLFFREEPEDIRARQEYEYEEKVVGHMLAYYGLSSAKSTIRNLTLKATGQLRLSFAGFTEHFADFPVHMGVTKQPGLAKQCRIDRLFNKVSTRKVVEHYLLYKEELDNEDGKPVALVFPWVHIPKGMVLHNKHIDISSVPDKLKKPCVRLVWSLSDRLKKKHGDHLTFEPLDQFLASLAWLPSATQ